MKVKIFQFPELSAQQLQNKVNTWLKKGEPRLRMCHVLQSESATENDEFFNVTITVFYEEG